ncbi:MAG: hypothetical protein V1857_02820, partial [archaeon]
FFTHYKVLRLLIFPKIEFLSKLQSIICENSRCKKRGFGGFFPQHASSFVVGRGFEREPQMVRPAEIGLEN